MTLHYCTAEIGRVLRQPQLVRRSRSDAAVRLFYQFYAQTIVAGKWLCVVVKYVEDDAFAAYLTDKPKAVSGTGSVLGITYFAPSGSGKRPERSLLDNRKSFRPNAVAAFFIPLPFSPPFLAR